MRVLLTGGTGFIGTALAAKLVARGDRVRALVRPTSLTAPLERLGAELAPGDVGVPASLGPAVEGCDLVIHLAGAVKALAPAALFRANADGTRHVAQACARAARPPRLVYVSSLSAAGPSRDGRPRVEEDAPAPVSLYGESKLAGERAVREVAGRVHGVVVRPPAVYGPGDRELVPQLLQMARLGVVARLGGAARRYSLVHVDDLCEGLLAAAERGVPVEAKGDRGLYFLAHEDVHEWLEVAAAAFAPLGRKVRPLRLPAFAGALAAAGATAAARLTGEARILSFDKLKELRETAWTCSPARAARELGWRARYDLTSGMADAVAWFRERGLA